MKQPNVERVSSGLQCDSPTCDWIDKTIQVEDYKDWLNAPCPKCGENVLTEEDCNMALALYEMVNMLNNLSEEEIQILSEATLKDKPNHFAEFKEKYNLPEDAERLHVTLKIHKGISIESVKSDKDE